MPAPGAADEAVRAGRERRLPEFRGRGTYRALIARRWRSAVADAPARPALVTQAGAMSGPILAALGFTAIGRVEMLVDEVAANPTA